MIDDFTQEDVDDLAQILFDGEREACEIAAGFPVGSRYSRWGDEYDGAEDDREAYRIEARAALRAGCRRVEGP